MRKFFTADFHFGMESALVFDKMPFKSIEAHDLALLRSCKERAKKDDVIYHLGDLSCFKMDRGSKGSSIKASEMLKDISATFINIRGNHDLNNKVKSICDSMHMFLSKRYPSVTLSHYPTYDQRIDSSCLHAPIHLHGHVHGQFKHCLDLDHKILNINVGCMVWGWKIVSDVELIDYLNKLFRMKPDKLYRCKKNEYGKVVFLGEKQFN